MAFDLKPDVALFEQHGLAVAAQDGVAKAGLETIPARGERARDVTAVLVVHAEQCAKAVLLHHLTRALDAVLAQTIPVDLLLPISSGNAEIRTHGLPPQQRGAIL